MDNRQDWRDVAVLVLVSLGWAAGTVTLFLHYTLAAFGVWSGFSATIVGAYHWLCVSDDKRVDAGNVVPQMDIGALAQASMARDWRGEAHGAT